jgi:hypothetical protein
VIRKDKVTLTGDAGTSYSKSFSGRLVGIYVDNGNLAATTDIVVTDEETGFTVLTITNLTADKMYMPRALNQDLAGADTAIRESIPVVGRLKFVVAQGGASNVGSAWVYVDEGGAA